MYKAAPNEAPEDIPNTDGEAIGFLKSACMAIPATESEAPTTAAQISLGVLMSLTI